jgi:hypothetical protein
MWSSANAETISEIFAGSTPIFVRSTSKLESIGHLLPTHLGRTPQRELRKDAERRGKDLSKNKARWCTSFVHLVMSPARRAKLSDEDFRRLAEPWVRDAEGRTLPHVGAVHREGGGHLHLAIVRDKFSVGELKALKDRTDGLAMSLGLEQKLEQERELALGGAAEMGREEISYGLEL